MDKIDERLIQSVILLDRQFCLIERLIETHHLTLANFEEAIEKKEQNLNCVLDVYNYAFSLIDHLDRFRKIALIIPKLNQKTPEYRAFISSMGKIKDLRDQIQHINNDVENNNIGPLLGSVCWISEKRQFIASFNDIGRERTLFGPIYDTITGQYIHEFCFVYNEEYHDLQKAIKGVKLFIKYIKSIINVQVNSRDYETKDHFSALCTEFQFKTKSS
jgi:hypothetical protein